MLGNRGVGLRQALIEVRASITVEGSQGPVTRMSGDGASIYCPLCDGKAIQATVRLACASWSFRPPYLSSGMTIDSMNSTSSGSMPYRSYSISSVHSWSYSKSGTKA